MSDPNKNYLRGRIIALETEVEFLKAEVEKWKASFDDAHAALQLVPVEELSVADKTLRQVTFRFDDSDLIDIDRLEAEGFRFARITMRDKRGYERAFRIWVPSDFDIEKQPPEGWQVTEKPNGGAATYHRARWVDGVLKCWECPAEWVPPLTVSSSLPVKALLTKGHYPHCAISHGRTQCDCGFENTLPTATSFVKHE